MLDTEKNSSHPFLSRLFETTITRSWWVILFFILSFAFFEQSAKVYNGEMDELSTRRENLLNEKQLAQSQNDHLRRQMASMTDRTWIELTLIKVLGLVPEGQRKVYFESDDQTRGSL